jgi:flagellar biosynthesis protein FlhF
MRIMKFEGSTMRDALAKVKAELGDQAVIVSTREVRRGLLGTAMEVSAAIEEDDAWSTRTPPPPPPVEREPDVEKLLAPLKQELRSLRALVRAAGDNRHTNELRNELVALRALVENIRLPATQESPRVTDQITAPSTARIVMLVGPTGAGKTTTIAKIAARAALIDERRVQLITLDNYRVGGVEQIRTYADLIGVPLATCESPADLPTTIDDTAELILIDTAGRSPRDLDALEDLAATLGHMPPVEVHLVIPAVSSQETVDDLIARYRVLRPKRLLFTKVDEVSRAPELAAAPARTGIPVTWITNGQAVPEDIEEPTRARLLELSAQTTHSRAA